MHHLISPMIAEAILPLTVWLISYQEMGHHQMQSCHNKYGNAQSNVHVDGKLPIIMTSLSERLHIFHVPHYQYAMELLSYKMCYKL